MLGFLLAFGGATVATQLSLVLELILLLKYTNIDYTINLR